MISRGRGCWVQDLGMHSHASHLPGRDTGSRGQGLMATALGLGTGTRLRHVSGTVPSQVLVPFFYYIHLTHLPLVHRPAYIHLYIVGTCWRSPSLFSLDLCRYVDSIPYLSIGITLDLRRYCSTCKTHSAHYRSCALTQSLIQVWLHVNTSMVTACTDHLLCNYYIRKVLARDLIPFSLWIPAGT